MSLKKTDASLEPRFDRHIPAGDNMDRDICSHCGYVAYDNPKIVVGSVVRQGSDILLCRRAIAPRIGYWTLPAGYLELNESPIDGACREAREEANARIEICSLLAVYSIARLSQVQLIYRAILDGDISPGPESQEVALFAWQHLPWEDMAFPSVTWALHHDRQVEGDTGAAPFSNPPHESADRMPPFNGL